MDKKDEYRFTIQFSPTDPRHQQVADILNRQGRRKAQYLVNAVLCYESKTESATQGQPSSLNYQAIKTIVNQILSEKLITEQEQVMKPSALSEIKSSKSEELTFEDVDLEIEHDSLSVIADSIAEFRKKQ